MKINESKMSPVAIEVARAGKILDQTMIDGEPGVFVRPPMDRDERRLIARIQEKYGVREDEPPVDPRFPDRPDHPDFWRLSKIVIENDDTATGIGLDKAVEQLAGVDFQSLNYMAGQRASRMISVLGLDPASFLSIHAAIMDGFVTGVQFQQERELGFRDESDQTERNEMSTAPVCPRCRGYIPSNDRPGAYPGAISRWDNETEICSTCGAEEAFEQLGQGIMHSRGEHRGVTPPDQWPVNSVRRRVDDADPVDSEHRRQALSE